MCRLSALPAQERVGDEFSKTKNWVRDSVAEALGLMELVSYQEGSVVSRALVSRETGNVTLFAFDEGQGLSEHTAPFDALAQVLEGEVEISIDRKSMHAKTGDVVLMPAHRPHALKAITRFKMLLTMIRSHGTV